CLGVQFRQIDKIWVAPAAASPWDASGAIVHRQISRERILAGDDVVVACEAKIFRECLYRIRVGDGTSVGTVRGSGLRPEVFGKLQHTGLQTGNRRTNRQTSQIRKGL